MAERMVLVLDAGERGAIAHDLRRYGAYRQRVADDLVDAHVLPEPGEPDSSGITPQVVAMVDSHVAVAEHCEALAAAFDGDDPVSLTRPDLRLVEETVSEAYLDDLPPEVARTAMFCRVASRRLHDADPPAEVVAVNMELHPAATERYVLGMMHRLGEANAALSAQLAELRRSQDVLTGRLQAQQREIAQLRGQGGKRRRLPNPFTSAFEPTSPTPRRPETEQGRSL
jgi:hypothetical protein